MRVKRSRVRVSRTIENARPKGLTISMVRSLDSRWNHILLSLYLMQRKLANLGVVLVDGEVYYSRQEDNNALV